MRGISAQPERLGRVVGPSIDTISNWRRERVLMKRHNVFVCLAVLAVCASSAWAAILNVGPGRPYTKIQDAINAAANGDTILVDSGTYVGRDCTMLFNGPCNITVKGNGPTRPVLDMGPDHSVSIWGKGICTATPRSSNIKFDGLEFIHAAGRDLPPWNDDGHNGAGIRWDGGGLCHVTNCSFHDNETGMLITTTQGSSVLIEGSVFHDNGDTQGTSAKHNIYGGSGGDASLDEFTLRYSWVYNATTAHDVKISAKTVKILYNRLGDELISVSPLTWGGCQGNAIDVPKGGLTYIIGNMITKGEMAGGDGNVVRYGEEGIYASYSKQAYILYNTYNGERSSAQNNFNIIAAAANPAILCNNIFYSTNPGDVMYSGNVLPDFTPWNIMTWSTSPPHLWSGLVNVGRTDACGPAAVLTLDYHLVGSPPEVCGMALLPGSGYPQLPSTGPDGFSLKAVKQFPNSPSNNPTLVGQNRSNCVDYGAYADSNITTINQAPIVNAGPSLKPIGTAFANRVVTRTNGLLMGAASDDGLPNPPGAMTYTWSKVSGPGTFTPAANALITTANFSASGTYTLQLAAYDGALTGTATCTVYVEDFTVDAGADQNVLLNATVNLAGTCTYDGPGARTYEWSRISGPAGITFGAGNALTTTATGFTAPGAYVLQLLAYDGGACVRDTVTITAVSRGDINNDGKVDMSDLLLLAWAFGSVKGPPASPNWNAAADLNGDGAVDSADLLILATNFGWQQ
jgi:hypothetical protein